MTPSLEELIASAPKLGSYAGVLRKLDRLIADAQTTMTEICSVIEQEPALAAKMLQLGNTCFFGFARRVETVFETVCLIGIQQVRDLVATATILSTFEGISSDYVDMESFWQHSLACAVAARILAIERQLPKPENYFTAGLLHDIGRQVLFTSLPKHTQKILALYSSKRLLLREAEVKVLGYDHAEIGAALLQAWHYPFRLIHAVRFHHAAMSTGAYQMEAGIVHLADFLVCSMEFGCTGETRIPPLNMKVWERIGLSTNALESVTQSIDEQYNAVEAIFLAREVKCE